MGMASVECVMGFSGTDGIVGAIVFTGIVGFTDDGIVGFTATVGITGLIVFIGITGLVVFTGITGLIVFIGVIAFTDTAALAPPDRTEATFSCGRGGGGGATGGGAGFVSFTFLTKR